MGRERPSTEYDSDEERLRKKDLVDWNATDLEKGDQDEKKSKEVKEWKKENMFVMLFGLDVRSLALMRVCLSVIIILDLYVRSLYLHAHYSKWAVLPPAQVMLRPYIFSLHFINSHIVFQAVLFVINAVVALCFLVGYKTRVSNFLCWIFMVSLHNRNPYVLNAGDDVIRLFLFWSMFLPLGKCASIDSIHNAKPSKFESTYHLSSASVAALGQFCIIYWFTAAIKTGSEWNITYTATYYAMHLDQFATKWAVMLREYHELMRFLTISVIYWEKLGPLLFFIPLRPLHGPLRTFAVLGFLFLHFGFGTCLELGFFMYIPGACVVSFLPSWFWDNLLRFFRRAKANRLSISLFYSSDHPTVYKTLLLFRTFFLLHETPISPTSKPPTSATSSYSQFSTHGSSYDPSNLDDISELHNHNYWFSVWDNSTSKILYGHEAIVKLASASPILFIFTPLLKLHVFSRLYTYLASNFSQGTMKAVERITPNKPYEDLTRYQRLSSNMLAMLLFLYILNWNFAGLYEYPVEPSIRWIGPALKLDQWWGMFAPKPPKRDGWLVMPGELKDGTQIDVFTGQPITYEKPALISAMYPTQRWRKFLMNLQRDTNKEKRLYYGRYLCREWNFWDRHPDEKQLVKYKIILMIEMTPEPGDEPSPITQTELWSHQC